MLLSFKGTLILFSVDLRTKYCRISLVLSWKGKGNYNFLLSSKLKIQALASTSTNSFIIVLVGGDEKNPFFLFRLVNLLWKCVCSWAVWYIPRAHTNVRGRQNVCHDNYITVSLLKGLVHETMIMHARCLPWYVCGQCHR